VEEVGVLNPPSEMSPCRVSRLSSAIAAVIAAKPRLGLAFSSPPDMFWGWHLSRKDYGRSCRVIKLKLMVRSKPLLRVRSTPKPVAREER
jgi:hypothetical protein